MIAHVLDLLEGCAIGFVFVEDLSGWKLWNNILNESAYVIKQGRELLAHEELRNRQETVRIETLQLLVSDHSFALHSTLVI